MEQIIYKRTVVQNKDKVFAQSLTILVTEEVNLFCVWGQEGEETFLLYWSWIREDSLDWASGTVWELNNEGMTIQNVLLHSIKRPLY
jgi:hypothetical protein